MNAWLKNHLDTFVTPRLKGPIGDLPKGDSLYYYIGNTPSYKGQFKGVIQCYLRAKELANGKTLLLPGRDSWLLRVLAGMDGYPVAFRPKLNSATAHVLKGKMILNRFGADCGYHGSAFQTIGLKHFAVTTWQSTTGKADPHSLNPGPRAWVDPYGMMCTVGAFYWQRAEVISGKIKQPKATIAEIRLTAQRTIAFVEAVEKEPLWLNRNATLVPDKPKSTRKRVAK